MKLVKSVVPGLILLAGLILNAAASFAKPEYTKKEKKACITCHVSASSKDLNAAGKCYKDKKSLDGCAVEKK